MHLGAAAWRMAAALQGIEEADPLTESTLRIGWHCYF